jgi:hypothetical protein
MAESAVPILPSRDLRELAVVDPSGNLVRAGSTLAR